MEKVNNKTKKTRNWATIVYPESAPENWEQIITDLHVPLMVSPCHDSDIDKDGEIAKPHYHVIMCFDGPKTQSNAKQVFDLFGGVGCEYVQSLCGYARYLCHLDNPDKAQYSVDDVIAIGIDYRRLIMPAMTADDIDELLREITIYICDNHITQFSPFMHEIAATNPDWFKACIHRSHYVYRLITAEGYNMPAM